MALSNAQQSLGISDHKRYSKGKEASIIIDCGFILLDSNNNTCTAGLYINKRAGSSAIRL